jgi:hypothetical protein
MTKRQAKAPAAVVVIVEPAKVQVAFVEPLGVMVIPSNVSVTCEVPPKPAPRAVAVEPKRPGVGPTVKVHAVTVNAAESFCPDWASVARTGALPVAPLGTAMVQTNPPPAAGVMAGPDNVPGPQVEGVTAMPSIVRVTVEPAAVENAKPVTVTEPPTSPVVGDAVSNAGVKDVEPVTVPTPATIAVAVTVKVVVELGLGIDHVDWLTTVTLEGPLIVTPEGPAPVKV